MNSINFLIFILSFMNRTNQTNIEAFIELKNNSKVKLNTDKSLIIFSYFSINTMLEIPSTTGFFFYLSKLELEKGFEPPFL